MRPATESPLDLVEVHLAQTLAAIRPLTPERCELESALGRVLAGDARATCALPLFHNSAMDGYAVHAADVASAAPDAPVTLPVTDHVAAGDTRPLTVAPGTCMRIMTGALLPGGADAVVPVEWTDGGTTQVRINQAAQTGASVRRRGSDVAEDDVLLSAGTVLGPAQIGLLAAAGHGHTMVHRQPKVAVIATGDELAEPGQPLVPGQIWDSNSYQLAAAVRQAGGLAERHRVADRPNIVLADLEGLSRVFDLLITTGGVSMGGEYDVVKAALSGREDMTFRRVAMQPGMPQGFGVIGPDDTPVFMLPGNPVSAFVSFHVFVRPALDVMRGLAPAAPPAVRASLAGPVQSPPGRRSYLRGVLDAGAGTVTPLAGQGSHHLSTLARANALIVVPEEVTGMAAGDSAAVMPLP